MFYEVQHPEKIIQEIYLQNREEMGYPRDWDPHSVFPHAEFFNKRKEKCSKNFTWTCFEARRKDNWRVEIKFSNNQWKFKVSKEKN